MVQYMAYLENSKKYYMSENPIDISMSSVEVERIQTRGPSIVKNHSEDYSNEMNHCINGLSEKMLTISSSIEPLIDAFKLNKGFYIDSNEVI